MPLRVAIPDMISPSYFPAIAAVELGFFKREGLDATIELIFPVTKTYEMLRDGVVDYVGGAAHAPLYAFPNWHGCKIIGALSQHMYWFLVMRKDLNIARGDLKAVRGLRIGAAPGPVDGFWANGMGYEVAVRSGIGSLVLDARRGDGPAGAIDYTFAAWVTTQKKLDGRPDEVAAAVRAMVAAQQALKADPSIAPSAVGKHFPAAETALIAELIRRDAPFYDPSISVAKIDALNQFGRDMGLLSGQPTYSDVVATSVQPLWRS